jgi:zinc transporter ZupT
LAEQKRELEDELVVDVKQRYEDGATKRRQQVDGVSGSRRKTRVRGDTLDEVEGGALRMLEEELLEEDRYQGIAKVYDSLDADASNRSLDAVRATYVHAVMNTEDHGQMQHHLARSLLLDIRLPWYQVCAADVRVAKNLLAKVMLQRKMASAVAHSLRMGKEQGSRRKQASNAEKLEALMHYAAMLDYMKDLLAGKLRKMRFALIRRAIRACVERRREDLSRPECIRAATIIQKYYRTYRVRRLLDLCAALQQQLHNSGEAHPGGKHQRRPAAEWPHCIRKCSPLKKEARNLTVGMVIDGVPESVAVGLTLHTASIGVSGALVGSIFIAAIPEAIGIAAALLAGGIALGSILLRFSFIVIIGAVFSAIGYSLLVGASDSTQAIIQSIAAGALLVVVINEMIPIAVRNIKGWAGIIGTGGFVFSAFLTWASGG